MRLFGAARREPRARLAAEAADSGAPARLADTCRKVLLTRVAQAGGRASVFEDDRAAVDFASPVRALGAALRVQYDLAAAMRDLPAGAPRYRYRIGVGASAVGAAALCARAEPGGVCVDDAVLAAADGKLDFESEALGAVAPGSPLRAHAVTGTLTGRVFRYKPWTTPGRRRASLVLAAAVAAAVVAVLAAGG